MIRLISRSRGSLTIMTEARFTASILLAVSDQVHCREHDVILEIILYRAQDIITAVFTGHTQDVVGPKSGGDECHGFPTGTDF